MGRPLANFFKEILIREGYAPDYTVVSESHRRKVYVDKRRDLYHDFSYVDAGPISTVIHENQLTTTPLGPAYRSGNIASSAPVMSAVQTHGQIGQPTAAQATAGGGGAPSTTPSSTGTPSGGGGGGGGLASDLMDKASDTAEAVSAATKKNPYLKYGLIGAGILVALFIYKKYVA